MPGHGARTGGDEAWRTQSSSLAGVRNKRRERRMDTAAGSAPADLLVIGGGMAGLTAGAWAARHGARVIVVERAPSLGGSAAFAGFVWTTPTVDAMQAVNPGGDPELGRALVEGFADGIEW